MNFLHFDNLIGKSFLFIVEMEDVLSSFPYSIHEPEVYTKFVVFLVTLQVQVRLERMSLHPLPVIFLQSITPLSTLLWCILSNRQTFSL